MPLISKVATSALLAAAGSVEGPIGTAIGALVGSQIDIFKLGGVSSVLEDTKRQWLAIKERLDGEAAWPIGLIYGHTANPIDQHQVLAIGYEDNADGTALLDVWDNNDANDSRQLHLDFRGDELQVTRSTGSIKPIKGIFLEAYSPQQPPSQLRLP